MTLLTLKTTKRDKETMQGEIVELTANSDRPSVPSPWKEVDGHCIASKGCCRNSYGLPRCVSVGKKAPSNVGDTGDAGSIPGLGRFPGEGKGNPLQYSLLENPTDRGAWWATVHGVRVGHTTATKTTLPLERNPPANAGDLGLNLRWGRSPGGGNGCTLQYSCLESPMDRGAWRATVHGITKRRT